MSDYRKEAREAVEESKSLCARLEASMSEVNWRAVAEEIMPAVGSLQNGLVWSLEVERMEEHLRKHFEPLLADLQKQIDGAVASANALAQERGRLDFELADLRSPMKCGHPQLCLRTSAETGKPLFCNWCDSLERARDVMRDSAPCGVKGHVRASGEYIHEPERDVNLPVHVWHCLACEQQAAAVASWKERAEQAETQLAACGVAALGWNQEPAKPGDWGWSTSYRDVLNLRHEYEQVRLEQPRARGPILCDVCHKQTYGTDRETELAGLRRKLEPSPCGVKGHVMANWQSQPDTPDTPVEKSGTCGWCLVCDQQAAVKELEAKVNPDPLDTTPPPK